MYIVTKGNKDNWVLGYIIMRHSGKRIMNRFRVKLISDMKKTTEFLVSTENEFQEFQHNRAYCLFPQQDKEDTGQTFLTDSLTTCRGVVVAFCLMTRLTTNAYAGSFHTLLRLNPELWSIDTTHGRLVLKFFVIVKFVDFADSQRKGIMLALKMLHESQCPTAPWTPTARGCLHATFERVRISLQAIGQKYIQ